jgi:hypothetical protein
MPLQAPSKTNKARTGSHATGLNLRLASFGFLFSILVAPPATTFAPSTFSIALIVVSIGSSWNFRPEIHQPYGGPKVPGAEDV